MIWELVTWICSSCENSQDVNFKYTLKIVYFYVYHTSVKIKIQKYLLIVRKKDVFSKREEESNPSSIISVTKLLIYWALYCVTDELNILFLNYFIWFSQKPSGIDPTIILILQKRETDSEKIKLVIPCHTAGKLRSQNLKPGFYSRAKALSMV